MFWINIHRSAVLSTGESAVECLCMCVCVCVRLLDSYSVICVMHAPILTPPAHTCTLKASPASVSADFEFCWRICSPVKPPTVAPCWLRLFDGSVVKIWCSLGFLRQAILSWIVILDWVGMNSVMNWNQLHELLGLGLNWNINCILLDYI